MKMERIVAFGFLKNKGYATTSSCGYFELWEKVNYPSYILKTCSAQEDPEFKYVQVFQQLEEFA